MAGKIPLDQMMSALDHNRLDFYKNLTDEQKKAWSPWLSMRYGSSASGANAYHYLLMVNSLVNVDFNTLRHHPQLQWQLLALCGCGSKAFHPWIAPGKKGKKDKVYEFLCEIHPEMNRRDVIDLCAIITTEELTELAKSYGLDAKAIKELTK